MLALCLLGLALTSGLAGPVQVLVSGQTIVATVLNAVFYHEALGGFDIAGIVVGIVGTCVISLSPLFYKSSVEP